MRHFALIILSATLVGSAVSQKANSSASKPEAPSKTEISQPATELARLPVKRVVLYKNGVGYFEHSTRVHGNQELVIDFTTSQLNDVLKSLTAVDLGEGRISSVRYNSIAPLEERLKGLRLSFGPDVSQSDFLYALRGARVEVRSGSNSAVGHLLSVEKTKKISDKGDSSEVTEFSVMTDAGEMKNFVLGPGTSVRFAERDLNEEVEKYLALVGSARARDLRRMTISATGSGDRDIFVSYISEVPIWKSTYRFILPHKSDEKPILQGWAIVDNTVGEDWHDVQLSLIAGAPQSFVQQISQPYYTRRPVIGLPAAAMLTPQEHEATLNGGQGGGIAGGQMGGLPAKTNLAPKLNVGQTSETVEVTGAAPMLETENANVESVTEAEENLPVEAATEQTGDYFEYSIKQRITVNKNQSALVPILQARVEAEKVSLWNENSKAVRRALWITNSSGMTLDSGTFNVLDDRTFAGEGLLETVHPAERRLLSYAGDLAVHVTMQEQPSVKPISHIRIANGLMIVTREQRERRTYTVRNADDNPRQVVIEHPSRPGWNLAPDAKPEETTASWMRFRLAVGPNKTEGLVIEEFQPMGTQYQLTNLDDNQVKLIAQGQTISPELLSIFRKVLDQKNQVYKLSQQIQSRQREIDNISRDQNRLRENMKALKGSPEEKALLERYTKQLNAQEDRLEVLNRELADLKQKQDSAQSELDQMVQKITFDQNF